MTLEELGKAALKAAADAGAQAADVLVARGDGISMEMRNGALEQAEGAEGVDIGLRVMLGQRQASVSISDVRADAIRTMAERAVAMAAEAPEDPCIGLADPDQLAQTWDDAALDLEDRTDPPAAADLAERARIAEAAALGVDGISQVSSAGADYGRSEMRLMTSGGFSGGYARTNHSVACVAICGSGTEMERDFAFESRVHLSDLPDPEGIGLLAAARTLERAGATQPKTGSFPVLFDERVASGLIGHVLSAINGASIARGSSWLKDAMETQILPDGFDLVEEPLRARIGGSRPFDGEGLATGTRSIVENGVLKRWILDLANARKLGLESTANAGRGVGGPPSPSLSNVRLTVPNPVSRAQMLSDMGEGLLVTSMIGSTINPNTGDYSRGASGFWVRGGQLAEPVNECTIAGNLHDMLRSLTGGDDGRGHLSRVVPSLMVEGLTVAGS